MVAPQKMVREWPYAGGDLFDRAQALTTTPGYNGWTIKDTSVAGTPTYLCVSGGGLALAFTALEEAQNVCAYTNDVLPFDIDELQHVEMDVKLSGMASATSLAFGIAGARNDALDSVAQHAWFRMEGGTSTTLVVVETDDGTNDNDDKATTKTLSSTAKRFRIDFTNGTSDVRFYIDDDRVAATTTFDMSNYTGNLQPFIQLQKTASTNAGTLTILRYRVQYAKVIG